jgi:hypothetical protein
VPAVLGADPSGRVPAQVGEANQEVDRMNLFMVIEAVNSVALEHPEGCRCLACRAANQEPGALEEVIMRLEAGEGIGHDQ